MKYFITIGLIALSFQVWSQQDPMYTQYMFNLSALNSGAIGRTETMSIMMVDRFQWVGFDGAPRTYSLSGDLPMKIFNSGVGLSYVYDQIGPERSNNLYFDYAYHIMITPGIKLGMGLKAGFKVFSADFTKLGQEGVEDEQFSKDIYGDIMPNFGLGLFMYADDYYVGLSSPKMVNHKYEGTDAISGGEERHYYVVGGYVLPINENVVFRPSVYAKYVKYSPISIDLTANFIFKETFWAGLAYRSGDAIGLITQIQLRDGLRFGYSYDLSISKMIKASSGSHEIMLTYELKPIKGKLPSHKFAKFF